MKTIGFTEVYYTLWEVGEPYEEKQYHNGVCIGSDWKQSVTYIQNLAHDIEKAKQHELIAGHSYTVDVELRGHSSFTRITSTSVKDRENYYPMDCFSFGRMEGVSFAESTDVWQLRRAYRDERSARRQVLARRRLIELGEMVRHPYQHSKGYRDLNWGKRDNDGNILPKKEVEEFVLRNYMDKWDSDKIRKKEAINKMSGWFFENKEKVELTVKELEAFSFDGMYGTTYVRIYQTQDDKIVKYVGSSPVERFDEFAKVKGTVVHSEYQGVKETKLQRMKLIQTI